MERGHRWSGSMGYFGRVPALRTEGRHIPYPVQPARHDPGGSERGLLASVKLEQFGIPVPGQQSRHTAPLEILKPWRGM